MTEAPRTDGGRDTNGSESSSQLTYELESEPPSEGVIRAVSILANTSPLALDPLYHAIDPAYLDGIFEHASPDTELSFTYHGYRITVTRTAIHVRQTE